MGSQIFVAVESPSYPIELEHVPNWFEGWEDSLSRFRPKSELSKVNREAGMPTKVSKTFADVFETALYAEQNSGGLVTPVLLDAIKESGYDRDFDLLPLQSDKICPQTFSSQSRLDEVVWDAERSTICLPPDMHLDFGGTAKGWAALQAAERLGKYGPALVNAGGDIAISHARKNDEPWLVGVANPFNRSENLEILQLPLCGVATSGRDKRRWLQDDRWNHHIIDPHTSLPAETDILTVTVVASSVIEAELAAKTIFISGVQAGLAWLDERSDLAGILILENGECLYSQRMEEYLWS
ncbi:MAG: FAD:protein FMN transferase [Chloroflexi bacterium]|nr:FAD:protein FMN transferase [Chloroflexota bacterium]